MTVWNPSAPDTLGLEWLPLRGRSNTVASSGVGAAMRLASTVAESITSAQLYLPVVTTPGGRFMLDVYEAGNEETSTSETAFLWRPSKDGPAAGTWTSSHEPSPNLYQNINDANTGDQWGWSRIQTTGGDWIVFYLAGQSLVGKRVLEATPKYVTRGGVGVQALIRNIGAGTNHPWGNTMPVTSAPQVHYRTTGEINPATGTPWTAGDLAKLFTGTEQYGLGILTDKTAKTVEVQRLWMTGRLADERRVALGTVVVSTPGWVTVPLVTPSGGTWAKATGKSYTFVLRRSGDVGSVAWAYLDGESPVGAVAYAPRMTAGGLITALGERQVRSYAIGLTRSDAAPSVDSQPYATMVYATVTDVAPADQGLRDAQAAPYGRLRFLAANPHAETQPLRLMVRRHSDNVQMGGVVEVAAADLDTFPQVGDEWRLVDVTLPQAATLAASVDYYVRIETTGAIGYRVAGVDTVSSPADSVAHNSGARATYYNAGGRPTVDLLVTLATVPQVPQSFRLLIGQQDILNPGCAPDGVAVDAISFVRLNWDVTAHGDAFGYYEVDRSENSGGWLTIARITDEAVGVFEDYELRREVPAEYRIRAVRGDGSASDWALAGPVSVSTVGQQLLFVSNEAPHLNVGYQDEGPGRSWDFQDPPDRLVTLHGQDYQVAFRDLTRRGDAFSATLVLNATQAPDNPGRAVFDRLLAITRASLSYVAVLDHEGSRWFASVHVPQGRRRVRFYSADVRVVEVTDRPSIVDRTVG